MNGRDALEFMIAGASAVQVGTANFVNPRATMDIIDDIRDFMQQQDIPQLNDLVGSLALPS
jgi:dihydroorotate dehydrogenase (NAD+) catalytic subunit